MADDEPRTENDVSRSRRPWLIGAGVAVVVVVAIVVAVSVGSAQQTTTPASQSLSPVASGSAAPAETSTSASGSPSSASPTDDPQPTDSSAVPTAPDEAVPVPIDAPATAVPGLVFAISSISSVEGTASAVGEVAGPSIQFTVTATNTTTAPISLETTVVNVAYGTDQTPADSLSTGSAPLSPVVEAGGSAVGTYIFTVPLDQRANLHISVDYQTGTPIIVFEGAGPQ